MKENEVSALFHYQQEDDNLNRVFLSKNHKFFIKNLKKEKRTILVDNSMVLGPFFS